MGRTWDVEGAQCFVELGVDDGVVTPAFDRADGGDDVAVAVGVDAERVRGDLDDPPARLDDGRRDGFDTNGP